MLLIIVRFLSSDNSLSRLLGYIKLEITWQASNLSLVFISDSYAFLVLVIACIPSKIPFTFKSSSENTTCLSYDNVSRIFPLRDI